MLLTSWARELGLPMAARGDKDSLDDILRFVFGEHYIIQMKDGRSYEDKVLDTILGIMADEFRVHNTTRLLHGEATIAKDGLYPKVEMLAVGANILTSPIGKKSDVSLIVSVVKGWDAALPPPDIEGVVEMVRQSVTFYSLAGEWTSFRKDNL